MGMGAMQELLEIGRSLITVDDLDLLLCGIVSTALPQFAALI